MSVRTFKIAARAAAAAFAIAVLSACTSMKPEDFRNSGPRFLLEKYFAGDVKAWGIFEDRFGNLRRQFTVDIAGTWDGERLVLDERFAYSDGEKERRVWTITKTGEHTYAGTAGDVIGTASGESFGNAVNWTYRMMLKVGDDRWKVSFDDWMFLQPGGIVINRAVVRRWGIEIGTVTLAFSRAGAAEAAAARTDAPPIRLAAE